MMNNVGHKTKSIIGISLFLIIIVRKLKMGGLNRKWIISQVSVAWCMVQECTVCFLLLARVEYREAEKVGRMGID